jgi:hypothetical protein
MPDEGATMQGIECRYIWHPNALIAAFDFVACASEQVPSIDPRNRDNDNVLDVRLGIIGRRREHDSQYAVVDMSAWPEGEPFGEWFTEWARNWNIAVAD